MKKKIVHFKKRESKFVSDKELDQHLADGWRIWTDLKDKQKDKFKKRG